MKDALTPRRKWAELWSQYGMKALNYVKSEQGEDKAFPDFTNR